MTMKKNLFLLLMLLPAVCCFGQQLAATSFSDMYGVLHNPATAGSQKNSFIGASFRTQWNAMPGGPKTGVLFGGTYLPKAKLGMGAHLYTDETGPTRRNGLSLSYAYHVPVSSTSDISLGLEGRLQQFSFDRDKLQESLGSDPVLLGANKKIKGDAGFGLAFTNKKIQLGASVTQLIQSKLGLYQNATATQAAKLYRHYYVHGRYDWNVDDVTHIQPHFLFTYLPNAPEEFQGGVKVAHHDLFWYGVALRARQSWMVSAGLKVQKKLTIGYSFDIYTTPLSVFDKGSNAHELMLRYDFLKSL